MKYYPSPKDEDLFRAVKYYLSLEDTLIEDKKVPSEPEPEPKEPPAEPEEPEKEVA